MVQFEDDTSHIQQLQSEIASLKLKLAETKALSLFNLLQCHRPLPLLTPRLYCICHGQLVLPTLPPAPEEGELSGDLILLRLGILQLAEVNVWTEFQSREYASRRVHYGRFHCIQKRDSLYRKLKCANAAASPEIILSSLTIILSSLMIIIMMMISFEYAHSSYIGGWIVHFVPGSSAELA